MDHTQILLQYAPHEAVAMMLNLENGTNFSIEDIEIGPPSPGISKNTRVRLKIRRRTRKGRIAYGGEIDFEYDRLDVSTHFKGVLAGFTPDLPTSTQILLDEITRRIEQKFVLDDIVLEDIGYHNATTYTLRAKEESHRWMGSMALSVGVAQDLGNFLEAIAPTDLGPLTQAKRFGSVNAFHPHLNATALLDQVKTIPIQAPAQNHPQVAELLETLIPAPNTPGFRVPLYRNAYFEQGGTSWSVQGNAQLNERRVVLHARPGETARVFRQIQVPVNALLELNIRTEQCDIIRTGQLSIELLDPNTLQPIDRVPYQCSGGQLSDFAGIGLRQVYFQTPAARPWVALTLTVAPGEPPASATISQFSTALFPDLWRTPQRQVINDPAQFNSMDTGIRVSQGVLTFENGAERTLTVEGVLPEGRTSIVHARIAARGALPLQLQAMNGEQGAREISPFTPVGSKVSLLLNNSAAWEANNHLQIHIANDDQWALTELEVETLPPAWNGDLIPGGDIVGRLMGGQVAEVSRPHLSAEFRDGHLHLQQTSKTPGRFIQRTIGVSAFEHVTVKLRTRGQVARQMDLQLDGVQSARIDVGSGPRAWQHGDLRRTRHPASVEINAMAAPTRMRSGLALTLVPRDGALGDGVSIGTYISILEISATASVSGWTVDPTPRAHNLYGAQVTVIDLPTPATQLGTAPHLSLAFSCQFDPTRDVQLSVPTATIAYADLAQLESEFAAFSQLTRYGLHTTEDGTSYWSQLNALFIGQEIDDNALPAVMDMDVWATLPPWVVTAAPASKNLFGATVQYNGPIRGIDQLAPLQGLTHVCVLFLSLAHCTGYRGVVRVFYRLPAQEAV